MELRQALAQAIQDLELHEVGSPRMNAETLLMFTLGVDRAYLYAHPERQLTPAESERYRAAIAERATGKPAQYITGHQEFWGLDLLVTPAVLIPRPETEHVVETVLRLATERKRPWQIADVGTGSGCIALALATEYPHAQITAVDVSGEALEVARTNAGRLDLLQRIDFRLSDLFHGLPPGPQFDFVVSNPPYVGTTEADKVQREVRKFEPHVAVFGGERGLDVYRRLIPQARERLMPGGWLVMEIGYSIGEPVTELMSEFESVDTITDLQGLPRVVAGRKR